MSSFAHLYNIKTGVVRRLNVVTKDLDSWTITGGTIDIANTGNGIFQVTMDTTHSSGAVFATYHEDALAYIIDCDLITTGIGIFDGDTETPVDASGIISFKDGHKKFVFKNQANVGDYVLTSIITAKRA